MPVFDGQPVSAAVTNPAFLDAQVDDTAFGIITLDNSAPASGPTVGNLQGGMNHLFDTTGATDTTDGTTYTSQQRITDGDNHETALGEIDSAFHPSTGHKHTGVMGDGPPIPGSSVTGNPLRGVYVQGIDITTVTGTTWDVSSQFTSSTPSTSPTVEGVVVVAPYNKVILRHATGVNQDDDFFDADGNLVYGRLTESVGVWTLSFFVNLSGTETAYNFTSPVDIRFYFQQLFNPLTDLPVYSELAFIPSENTVADIPIATNSVYGKVILSSSASSDVGTSSGSGTSNGTVANKDHSHKGVASFAKTAGTLRYGAISLTPGTGITITDNGDGTFTIDGTSGGGGGGSQLWTPDEAGGNSPVQAVENLEEVWLFSSGLGQLLYTMIKVPTSYTAGSPINVKIGLYSPSSSNTILLSAVSTLIRKNTDAFTSTTNQRTTTNTALTNTVANQFRETTLDVTDGSGQINGVAVAAGDVIKVALTRGSDSDTADIRFVTNGTEVTFT